MRGRHAMVAVTLLVALAVPGSAVAARPQPPTITAVTITAAGGTWPYCEQVATLAYTSWPQRARINVMPALDGAETENHMATVRGTGSVEIAIAGHDYSATGDHAPNDPWRWIVWIWNRVATSGPYFTSGYDFHGACPAAGTILATWPAP
jgi:hypothetical protein